MDKVALGQVFSEHTGFPCQFSFHRLLHTHLLSGTDNTRPPVTVAERSKAWTVFARSEAGIVGSNPKQDMNVWYVYVLSCV
jgi:hypothetical protein